ncbi:MAG: type II toxin-antitoxin system VapC family toxin [Actinomycetota bacterium]
MIVLDTTVLVYAVGEAHFLREPCRAIVRSVAEGRAQATTTSEVIQEFAEVRARRRSRADAASLASEFAFLLSPLMTVDRDDLLAGLRLLESTESLGAFDAVLAATAMARAARALVSADTDFSSVRGLAHVAPGTPESAALLG